MQILESTFSDLQKKFKKVEALVFYGCGGDLSEWVNGITVELNKEKILGKTKLSEWYKLTTTGGRIDLVMVLPKDIKLSKLALWRLRFGDCGWWSDYIVNYAEHHGVHEKPMEIVEVLIGEDEQEIPDVFEGMFDEAV